MNDNCIGVFDSGIGGLTVVRSIVEAMPNENIIYFGDTAHVPYGTRSEEQITEYVMNDVKFLSSFNIKAVVIACNTADSIAREKVEKLYDLPFYGVVKPASEKAAKVTENGKIGVIATTATVNSGAYEKAIYSAADDVQVMSIPCPLLVPLVENNRYKKNDKVIETVLREYLEPLKEWGADTLVLGCTHYPLLSDVIEEILPGVTLISSSVEAANVLKADLEKRGLANEGEGGKKEYYVSDSPELFEKTAITFLGDTLGGSVNAQRMAFGDEL